MNKSLNKFELKSNYNPVGDQPKAIEKLVEGLKNNIREQTLIGVTGSGKTFTMANVIARINKPTLVLAHNKTLAAQLYSEFKSFFPNNSVEYFVSYYDYYQPESYVASTDTYIEKDSSINDEIDKLRHSATCALAERNDVIIVASVSCIYSLGNPIDYNNMVISLRQGMEIDRDFLLEKLIKLQYERNDLNFIRNKFRVHGDVVDVFLSYSQDTAVRLEFFGDEIDQISLINALTGVVKEIVSHIAIFPASHYVINPNVLADSINEIKAELKERIKFFESEGKQVEAQRIKQRTLYDIEMLQETGFCKGIENYSRIFARQKPGAKPYTLLDYFPDDFLIFVDESHVMLSQIRGMFAGDHARKKMLIDFGFRLPSAFDNRPLNFDEFYEKINKVIYVSATPGKFEKEHSQVFVEQVIRPTGLLDPEIEVKPIAGQIDDLIFQINQRVLKNEKVLITTLTKRMAEDLSSFFDKVKIKSKYMHSDIDALERMEIIRNLRLNKFDVLIGINLLREGLDIPEVSLVAILDADKEGFLRSETSLIQTIGRAARNANGKVVLYADEVTNSMKMAIDETLRRRKIQMAYNKKHGIVPTTVKKAVFDLISISKKNSDEIKINDLNVKEQKKMISELESEMKKAAKMLDFEYAIKIREKIKQIKLDLS